MQGVNKVIIVGTLGKAPEVRALNNGSVCNLSVATNKSWRDKHGEKHEVTEWHRVVIYNDNLVKIAEDFLDKGSNVYLEGELQTRKWTDKDDIERYTTEVVLGPYNSVLTLLGESGGRGRDRDDDRGSRGRGRDDDRDDRRGRGRDDDRGARGRGRDDDDRRDRGARGRDDDKRDRGRDRDAGKENRKPVYDDLDDEIPF